MEPVPGLLDRFVSPFAQLGRDILQLRRHPLPDRLSQDRELAALPDRVADMRESQKIKRLRFPPPHSAPDSPPRTARIRSGAFSPSAVPARSPPSVSVIAPQSGPRPAGAETPAQSRPRSAR